MSVPYFDSPQLYLPSISLVRGLNVCLGSPGYEVLIEYATYTKLIYKVKCSDRFSGLETDSFLSRIWATRGKFQTLNDSLNLKGKKGAIFI